MRNFSDVERATLEQADKAIDCADLAGNLNLRTVLHPEDFIVTTEVNESVLRPDDAVEVDPLASLSFADLVHGAIVVPELDWVDLIDDGREVDDVEQFADRLRDRSLCCDDE